MRLDGVAVGCVPNRMSALGGRALRNRRSFDPGRYRSMRR